MTEAHCHGMKIDEPAANDPWDIEGMLADLDLPENLELLEDMRRRAIEEYSDIDEGLRGLCRSM